MSDESPSVSVIVPCWHVGEYLSNAIRSLCAQTYGGKWDAIFVDDGDPAQFDGVEFPDDDRFKLIHQSNRGLSGARNAGLDVASGEIILFYDPDDGISNGWMQNLVNGLAGVDLAWGGFVTESDGKSFECRPPDVGATYFGDDVKRRVWRAVFGYRLRDVLRYLTPSRMWKGCGREFVGLWSRGYRREVMGDLRFDESLGLYEDAMFVSAYAMRAKSMRIIEDTGYAYYIRPKGLMMREERGRARTLHRFSLRDARRKLDPEMRWWRGSFVLAALLVLKEAGPASFLRYVGSL